jgi:hypothetical protein
LASSGCAAVLALLLLLQLLLPLLLPSATSPPQSGTA